MLCPNTSAGPFSWIRVPIPKSQTRVRAKSMATKKVISNWCLFPPVDFIPIHVIHSYDRQPAYTTNIFQGAVSRREPSSLFPSGNDFPLVFPCRFPPSFNLSLRPSSLPLPFLFIPSCLSSSGYFLFFTFVSGPLTSPIQLSSFMGRSLAVVNASRPQVLLGVFLGQA